MTKFEGYNWINWLEILEHKIKNHEAPNVKNTFVDKQESTNLSGHPAINIGAGASYYMITC